MNRKGELAITLGLSGVAALLFLAALSTTTPAVELESNSAAGFKQAAHDARSWAEQAFAYPPPSQAAVNKRVVSAAIAEANQHENKAPSIARQQALATEPTEHQQQLAPKQEPAVHVMRQPRFKAHAGARPVQPRVASAGSTFFRDAVSELGTAPSSAALKQASAKSDLSFDAAARSELAPAPRLSVLRAQDHNEDAATQQQLADAMTVTPHGTAPAGFAGKQYSLARESREGDESSAYDFGDMLASGRRVPVERAQQAHKASPARKAPPAPRVQAQQVSSRKARLDRWGIPIGAGEGVTTSRSEHVAASRKYQQHHRERGITGAQAREALGGYFRQLVAKAHAERKHRSPSTYYQTSDSARQQSLAQLEPATAKQESLVQVDDARSAPEPSSGTRHYVGVVVTPSLDSVVVAPQRGRDTTDEFKAAEENLKDPRIKEAQNRMRIKAQERVARRRDEEARADVTRKTKEQDAFQSRVDAAEKAIEKLTRKAEQAITSTAKKTAAKTAEKLEGIGKGAAAGGIRAAIKDVDATAAVIATEEPQHSHRVASGSWEDRQLGREQQQQPQQQEGEEDAMHSERSLRKHRGMSAKEAREDLFASMDDTFKHTRDQDEQDRERLNGRMHDPRLSERQVIHNLDSLARRERRKDLLDEQNLKSPRSLSAAVSLKHKERQQTEEEEAEYEDALKTALGKRAKGAPRFRSTPSPRTRQQKKNL